MIPILRTKRLTLRPLCKDDAARIVQHLDNFAVSGNLGPVPYPYTAADAEAFLASRAFEMPPDHADFAIDLGDHGMVGSVGYHQRDGRAILGYYLGQPYWGRGLMTEAATAAVDWFFQATDAQSLYSGAFAFNKPSLTVQKKLGFTETGRSMILCLARNQQVRHIDTKLTRDAWTGTMK